MGVQASLLVLWSVQQVKLPTGDLVLQTLTLTRRSFWRQPSTMQQEVDNRRDRDEDSISSESAGLVQASHGKNSHGEGRWQQWQPVDGADEDPAQRDLNTISRVNCYVTDIGVTVEF